MAVLTTNHYSKNNVDVATTGNISLSYISYPIIDGVQLVYGTRVLVKDQTNLVDNGIYFANTTGLQRAIDIQSSLSLVHGAVINVTGGTTNINTSWYIAPIPAGSFATANKIFLPSPFSGGGGGGGSLPITRYVYLEGDASDATLMGGVASNVYTTIQDAYDAAIVILTANPSYQVVIKVGMITAAQSGDLTLNAAAMNKSDRIFIDGINVGASIIGNITASGGSFLYLGASNVRIGNITTGSTVTVLLYNSTRVIINVIISCNTVQIVQCNNIQIDAINLSGGTVFSPSYVQAYGCAYLKLGDISGTNVSLDLGTPENGFNWNGHYATNIITSIDITNQRHFQILMMGVTIVHDFTYNASYVSSGPSAFILENTKVYGTTTINRNGNPQTLTVKSCSFEDLILTGSTFASLTMIDTNIKRIDGVPANTTFMNCTLYNQSMTVAPPGVGLTIGRKYEIVTYVAGDDFINIGAASNASGVIFTATGSFATNWYQKSVVREYEVINGIGTNCEFYNTSIVGGTLAIDNTSAVSVKYTSGMSSSRMGMGANITLT
jgi:hypothetical protein